MSDAGSGVAQPRGVTLRDVPAEEAGDRHHAAPRSVGLGSGQEFL